ncbi:MAG: arginine repressor [Bacteroidetes bacterium]|nr:arginine repressor [Bacteroidota bacterium]
MSSKLFRQNKIKEILQRHQVDSQDELVHLLKAEGIEITQATLSRDFSDLGVIRVRTEEGSRYVISQQESGSQVSRLIRYEVLNVANNENVIVVRTLAGRAQGVGHFFDRLNKPEILGTIAGDDTILIIPTSINHIPGLVKFFHSLMDEGEESGKA